MNQKYILIIGTVALLVALVGAGLKLYWPQISETLSKAGLISPEKQIIILNDSSQNLDITVDLKKLTEIYNANVSLADESTQQAYEPIIIELTDTRQANAYMWEVGKVYESITVGRIVPNGKKITLSFDPTIMEQAGWSKRDIESEIEVVLVQSVITIPTPTMTRIELEENKEKAANILEAINYEQFVTLQ